jgi:hypothetical protein
MRLTRRRDACIISVPARPPTRNVGALRGCGGWRRSHRQGAIPTPSRRLGRSGPGPGGPSLGSHGHPEQPRPGGRATPDRETGVGLRALSAICDRDRDVERGSMARVGAPTPGSPLRVDRPRFPEKVRQARTSLSSRKTTPPPSSSPRRKRRPCSVCACSRSRSRASMSPPGSPPAPRRASRDW